MFKSLVLFRISNMWTPNLSELEKALGKEKFKPCGPTDEKSNGWIEPRGQEHGAMVESIGGQWILKFCSEKKVLPGSVVKRVVEERAKKMEESSGIKPGKKALRDLKEDVIHELMPKAFTALSSTFVWIDPDNRMMVVDSGSLGKCDDLVSALVNTLEGFGVTAINTQQSPAACMSSWLVEGNAPSPFSIDRECELQAADESKSKVVYNRHNLDIEEVKRHISEGKLPTRLAMTWDDRVSFVLLNNCTIKKVNFMDVVTDDHAADEAGFDTDVAIVTAELSMMIPEVLAALGGELES